MTETDASARLTDVGQRVTVWKGEFAKLVAQTEAAGLVPAARLSRQERRDLDRRIATVKKHARGLARELDVALSAVAADALSAEERAAHERSLSTLRRVSGEQPTDS